MGKISEIAFVLGMLLLANPISAAVATYNQDGSPYITNGTATSNIGFINALDGAAHNITEAQTNNEITATELVLNGNFTGGSGADWAYQEIDPSNRASSNFLPTGGDAEAGRWAFEVNDNSRFSSFTVYGNLTNAGAEWDGTIPAEARLNFSFYKNYDIAPISDTASIFLIRPDGSQVLLWTNSTVFSSSGYTRVSIPVGINNFSQSGAYSIRLYNYIVTPVAGRPIINNYWDQASLVLKKDQKQYAFGVWHNSTAIATPANLNDITEINVSLRFRSDSVMMPAMQIYDFSSSSWSSTGCTPPAAIPANIWQNWNCVITSSPQKFISTDGKRRIRIRFYTPNTDTGMSNVSEDWLEYKITHTTLQSNSRLEIWDQTKPQGGSILAYTGETISFYANYTDANTGLPLSTASCEIAFEDEGYTFSPMSYNSGSRLFEYGRLFGASGMLAYNVSCTLATYLPRLSNETIIIIKQPSVTVNKPAFAACGNVFYEVKLFDRDEQPWLQAAGANISVSNSSLVLQENSVSISSGIYRGVYQLPEFANSGDWIIRVLSGALGKKSFHVGSGNSDVWKIELALVPTKGAYAATENALVSATVTNLKGIGVAGLQEGSSIRVLRDGLSYSPAITNLNNGTYTFNLGFGGLSANNPHSLSIIANSGSMDITSTRGFYVR
ncbi:MAG: hypothetical protein V1835_05635 [Candidatus Micrarchaeota archaeon]